MLTPTSNEPLDAQGASTWRLFYHKRNKRFLITSEEHPSDDFINNPASYHLFGGRRDGAPEVHEVGKAETVEELKQFVMVVNCLIAFDPGMNDETYYGRIQTAFTLRYANLIFGQ